mgnify:CR=1 FL=1
MNSAKSTHILVHDTQTLIRYSANVFTPWQQLRSIAVPKKTQLLLDTTTHQSQSCAASPKQQVHWQATLQTIQNNYTQHIATIITSAAHNFTEFNSRTLNTTKATTGGTKRRTAKQRTAKQHNTTPNNISCKTFHIAWWFTAMQCKHQKLWWSTEGRTC